jgi:tetratricopeptide (TPR) repeat protein
MPKIKVLVMIFLTCALILQMKAANCQESVFSHDDVDTTLVIRLYDSTRLLINSSPDTARLLSIKALKYSRELHFSSGIAMGYNYLGILAHQKGLFDSTEYYFSSSLREWEALDNQKQVSNLLGNLSVVFADQGRLTDAIIYNMRSIKLKLEFRDTIPLANGYNSLSKIYQDIGNLKEALYFQYKSLRLREAVNDRMRLSSCYGNLGAIYNLTGDLDSAYYFAHKALVLQTRHNNKLGLANSYGVLGEFHYLSNSLDSAMNYVDQSMALSEQLGLATLSEEMIVLQARIFIAQNKLDAALQNLLPKEKYLNTSLSISVLKILAQTYQKKAQYKVSNHYYDLFTMRNDSIQQLSINNKIAGLSAKYSYDLRELELKNEQSLKQADLELQIEQKQLAQWRLIFVLIFIGIILLITLGYFLSSKKKNQVLESQRQEIEVLNAKQNEIIQMRTTELLSSKDIISRYAFLNSHELRGPLARILGMIHLSDSEAMDQETFIKLLKTSATELDEAVRKIGKELNENS